jgi:fructoselysine 6-kinase
MTRVVAVGFSCVDVYQSLNKIYPTGNGVDFCIHLSRFGISTSVVSMVGSDKYGIAMIDALNHEGINTSHLHVSEGDTCKMVMGLNGNDRVHLHEIEGVMANFTLSDDDFPFINQHDYLHTDLFGKILHWLPVFKKNDLQIVMDFSIFFDNPEFQASNYFPLVDYFFASYNQRDSYIENFMEKTWGMGPKLVTITLGENGSLCFDGSRFYEHEIIPVEIVNTVGAGDSYIAGFMYGIINQWPIQDCMRSGTETAATVIAKFEPY